MGRIYFDNFGMGNFVEVIVLIYLLSALEINF